MKIFPSASKLLPSIANGYSANVFRMASIVDASSSLGGGKLVASLSNGMGCVPKGRFGFEVAISAAAIATVMLGRTEVNTSRAPKDGKSNFMSTDDFQVW